MAERVVDLFEVIDVDEVQRDERVRRRLHRQRRLQPFDHPRTVGKPGQSVVMGEEGDAAIRLLLFTRAPVPRDRRHAERQHRQAAQCGRRRHEGSIEDLVLVGLIDISGNDGNRTAADNYRHVGFRIILRLVGRPAFLGADDRLILFDRARGGGVVLGQIDRCDLATVGKEN